MNELFRTTAEDIRARNPYQLAGMADIVGPDSQDSPGANFLRHVAHDIVERYLWDVDNGSTPDADAIHEVADSAVPVYTYQLWQTFTDLAAWQEDDADELAGPDADMTQRAGVALYVIADRLARVIWDELNDAHAHGTDDDNN